MDNEKFELSVELAKQTIECGGEVSRSEETIKRINGSDCSVFALPSLIVAQSGNNTQIKRIYKEEINLAKLARINSVSRKLSNESNAIKNYTAIESKIFLILCDFLACASFSIFFGGNIFDAVFSGIIATLIGTAKFNKFGLNQFSNNLVSSFIAGTLSFIPILLKLNVHQDKIIIGTIMLFVPGLTVVNAIRDMMNSDLLAGMYELFGAVMSALSIAFGVAGAFWLFGKV